MPIPTTKNKNS